MLSSFFRVALLVTDGVAGYEDEHDEMLDYYLHHDGTGGNVDDWLSIARQWSYLGECGDSYYGNNIVMEPMYNLARLEDDPDRRSIVLDNILETRMWGGFANTKNSFFSFIYAASIAAHDPSVVDVAAEQLAQFPPPPRIKEARDLRSDARYMPHHASCSNQVNHGSAVDVADRCVSDFIWQRHPWGLLCDGNVSVTYPGVDYLAAYWMGRYHEFIDDDSPGRCLAWR